MNSPPSSFLSVMPILIRRLFILSSVIWCPFGAATGSDATGWDGDLPDRVSFNAHIRPIMSGTCFTCHGPDEHDNPSGLRLDSFEHATEYAIVPGDAAASEVFARIIDADDPMPPADFRHQLSPRDKALVKRWIEQGAEYQRHWSYTPIEKPAVPDVPSTGEEVQPIDAFVRRRLTEAGLEPSPPADRPALLRRLSLDLIGLPPTPEQVDAFVRDHSPDAFERQVDRLLASPHFGERMAIGWLDLVRFADTVGYHGDQNLRNFAYRDYVIDAFNSNKPFDQFTTEQLAGDLLADPTREQLVATGVLRLNLVTREGGAQPGEYLAKSTADRVRMLGTTWLGSTTGCCECHNHKYDPFTAKDFYSLGAFFDDVRQWGVYSEYRYTPNPDLRGFTNDHPFPPEIRFRSDAMLAEIDELRRRGDLILADTASGSLDDFYLLSWPTALASLLRAHPDGFRPIAATELESSAGTPLDQNGAEVLPEGEPRENDVIEWKHVADQPLAIRSIRLKVLPDPANEDRVGRGAEGTFAIGLDAGVTRVAERRRREQDVPLDWKTRYVRVELDSGLPLSLAEVQVLGKTDDGETTNLALSGTATQSSIANDGEAGRAIDGNTDGDYRAGSVTRTADGREVAWWEVDLKGDAEVRSVVVWNRTDKDYGARLRGYRVVLLDADRNQIWSTDPKFPRPSAEVAIPRRASDLPAGRSLAIAFAQADRWNPNRYRGGHEPGTLGPRWRSGPAVFRLPADETKMPHTAIYHLEDTLYLDRGDTLRLAIRSADIGRFRISVSPLSPLVVDAPPVLPELIDALEAIELGQDLGPAQATALVAAHVKLTTRTSELPRAFKQIRDEILDRHSGYVHSAISQPLPAEKIPVARVLPRGNWQDRSGEVVKPAFPEFLVEGSVDASNRRLTRLDLADWLTGDENPLVARHFVNRTWKQFFGAGLSGVLDDLGSQGEWPSHPELLDWLAADFRSDWDIKRLIRQIVSSDTYRQAAAVRDDLKDIDPYNRLLSQQSPRRLPAELVRDNALAIAGLINLDRIGGPSVFPYQPAGYYSNLQFPNRVYVADTDRDQYRRGVYMHWQRTFLHPMLVNFDAPARDECAADRPLSNSPQQALTLLNDPTFVEASRALAERLINTGDEDIDSWIDTAFDLAVARDAVDSERRGLRGLFDRQLEHYRSDPAAVEAIVGVGMADTEIDREQWPTLAALTQVCRVVLNLHETITRY